MTKIIKGILPVSIFWGILGVLLFDPIILLKMMAFVFVLGAFVILILEGFDL